MTYYDLGRYSRPVTTSSDAAQTWFDRGLLWVYGFHHEEAIACFERAIAADPGCAMAHWGVAFAIGPNYNKDWEIFDAEERVAALTRAHAALEAGLALRDRITPVEAALIEALASRYPTDPEIDDFGPWNDAFSEAMRPVHAAFPEDKEVASVFAEALMNRTPWQLWDLVKGVPAEGASTVEIRQVLETALDTLDGAWDHPGLLHLYIHLMEMSPTPELALPHGDRLLTLVPDSGHLVHMPSHIDVLCGNYQDVVERNAAASARDQRYLDEAGAENFYTVYRLHNLHFQVYGAMFLAQPEPALAAAETMVAQLTDPVVSFLPDLFEAFVGMKYHVLIRFGRWQEILDEPFREDRALYCFTTALLHYARTVALANLGRIAEAEAERDAFRAAVPQVAESRYMFNNPCSSVLTIAEAMLEGELAYKSGDRPAGLDHLRRAVTLDDGLDYDEPWGWMQPARHALAALLMDNGKYGEAEAVYRADLGLDDTLSRACQHPNNVWSLHGLHECLHRRGETVEILHVKRQLDLATARATVPIRASCYCRSGAAA